MTDLSQTHGHRTSRPTHKERVLGLLEDGLPHSHMEGYRLGVMLHSRVADLRRDGYEIACWRDGNLYFYRLLDRVAGAPDDGKSPRDHDPATRSNSRPLGARENPVDGEPLHNGAPTAAHAVTDPAGAFASNRPLAEPLGGPVATPASAAATQLRLDGPAFRKQAAA